MMRGYTVEEVRGQIATLRNIDPLFNITADMIVGFPGESQADFEESVALVTAMEMGHVHVFPFSQRPGTPAAGAGFSRPQVPGPEIRRRSGRLRRTARRSALAYREALIGSEEVMIVEAIGDDGLAEGYGLHYCRIRAAGGPETTAGSPMALRITGIDQDGILRGTAADMRRPARQASGPPGDASAAPSEEGL
jgi:threonylcarbamoyladenosine tRNA methylthiotransferase MtaB